MTPPVIVPGVPMGKPRMTRSDKWKKRDCVMRYRTWADDLRRAFGYRFPMHQSKPVQVDVRAYFPIPAGWSDKKKQTAKNAPHEQKPDGDNILKGILDSLVANDQRVYRQSIEKRWDDGNGARVEILLKVEA